VEALPAAYKSLMLTASLDGERVDQQSMTAANHAALNDWGGRGRICCLSRNRSMDASLRSRRLDL